MDPSSDVMLVGGVVLLALFMPAAIGGLVERKIPFIALPMAVIAAFLIFWALRSVPGGFSWSEWRLIPDAFIRVLARIL